MASPGSSAPVRRARLDPPFFRAKFRVPDTAPHFVSRPRLLDLLDELAEYPITAISAPAGAGKTALVADWVRRRGRPVAWLRIDPVDRDPEQLRASLATLVGLAEKDVPTSLVIDDVSQFDAEDEAAAVLEAFVEQLPSSMHLVVVGRHRVPLPVERLRATGRLADVGFDLLRLSEAEAVQVLSGMCPGADPEAISAIARRADGWAAAVQLMGLALRAQRHAPEPRTDLAVPDRLLDTYLWRDVLGAERPELVDLLLRTAVVDRMNVGLAEVLTGRIDAAELLEQAEARGLFVTSLDAGGWYEVHRLVREVLTSTVRRRAPAQLEEQHALAAAWFESVADGVTALDHWVAARRPREALRTLVGVARPLLATRRTATIGRILDQVPVTDDPAAALELAWCRLLVDPGGFPDALAAAERGPESTGLDVLRGAAAGLADDWRTAELLARRVLTRAESASDPIDNFASELLAHALALSERWQAGATQDPRQRWALEGVPALGLALAGHPRAALDLTAAGVEPVALRLGHAVALREVVAPAPVHDVLTEIAATPSRPFPQLRLLARLELVDAAIATGRLGDAATAFDEARRGAAAASVPLTRTGVRLALARGDTQGAAVWSARVRDPFWGPACAALVRLALGRPDEAAEYVGRARPRCVRQEVVGELLRGATLAERDRDRALKQVEAALDLAAEHDLVRTVATYGAPVRDLVERAAWRAPDAWMDRLRRVLLPAYDRSSPARSRLVEELTEREREVLRLLPTRLTLREVAADLFVSQNTLKFHLRGIYRKLDAGSRSEAVRSARDLGLLPPG